MRLHQSNTGSTNHDCRATGEKVALQVSRRNILEDLMWQAISEEFPQSRTNDVNLTKGWLLVSMGDNWSDDVLVSDKLSLLRNIIKNLMDIVNGTYTGIVDQSGLDPVAEDEKVLATIDDIRIRALYSLAIKIQEASATFIGDVSLKDHGKNEDEQTSYLAMLLKYFRKLSELINRMIWSAIFDLIPEFAQNPYLVIRQDWKIVECPPSEETKGLIAGIQEIEGLFAKLTRN